MSAFMFHRNDYELTLCAPLSLDGGLSDEKVALALSATSF